MNLRYNKIKNMLIIILIFNLLLQASAGEKEPKQAPEIVSQALTSKLSRVQSFCKLTAQKKEFYHQQLWPQQFDWQIRGDQLFTNCVEKALFCAENDNYFALANLETVHVPRLVAAYHSVLSANLESKNKIHYIMLQSSFNLFKSTVLEYKDKYQIARKAQEISNANYLSQQLKEDFTSLGDPKINAKTSKLLESLAHDIKTKYKF